MRGRSGASGEPAKAQRRKTGARKRRVTVKAVRLRDTLAARILIEEHRIYPEAIQLVLDGGWRIDGRRVVRA